MLKRFFFRSQNTAGVIVQTPSGTVYCAHPTAFDYRVQDAPSAVNESTISSPVVANLIRVLRITRAAEAALRAYTKRTPAGADKKAGTYRLVMNAAIVEAMEQHNLKRLRPFSRVTQANVNDIKETIAALTGE